MRTTLAYSSARILLFVASAGLLYLFGARSWVLLVLAFFISMVASYVLLSRYRDKMSAALVARQERRTSEELTFRERLKAGASAEDND